MGALARGQASDCSNPVLDLFTQVNGLLTDVFSLEFQIYDVSDAIKQATPVQVFPVTAGQRATVDIGTVCPAVGAGKISTGHFVAEYTPDLGEALGTHQIRWYFKLTAASAEQEFREEFEVLAEVVGSSGVGYCFVQDVRDAGITVAQADDAKVQSLISLASRYIDKVTGRFFEPRTMTITLDGDNRATLFLDQPIIGIDQIRVGYAGSFTGVDVTDPESYKVYNRHLSQGLVSPDDRDHPHITLIAATLEGRALLGGFERWPKGHQNIEITGTFGYTDPDGSNSSSGKTPDLIRHICTLLVLRFLPSPTDPGAYADATAAWRIKREKTRHQEVEFHALLLTGAFTGDPNIDNILVGYMRPAQMGIA